MTLKQTLAIALLGLSLNACTTMRQYTSGADYLSRYNKNTASKTFGHSDVDQSVREIAAVEPNLQFPARIGLARIYQGTLVSVPADEAEHWRKASESVGQGFGSFIPVSPLVAQMVSTKDTRRESFVIDHIRRGAARQHLDYVIAYEVTDQAKSDGNALRLADLTILGLFVLPSRDLKAEATASAILLDVRNGYPYLTGSTFTDEKGISTVVGRSDRKDKLREAARHVVVSQIANEFADGLRDLKHVADGKKLANNSLRQSAASN